MKTSHKSDELKKKKKKKGGVHKSGTYGLEPTIYRTRSEYTNHYTTNADAMVYVHFYIVSKCTGCRILFLDEFSFISTNVRLAKISTIYVILKEEKTKENRLNRLKIDKQDSNKKQTRPKDVKDLFMALCYNQ